MDFKKSCPIPVLSRLQFSNQTNQILPQKYDDHLSITEYYFDYQDSESQKVHLILLIKILLRS